MSEIKKNLFLFPLCCFDLSHRANDDISFFVFTTHFISLKRCICKTTMIDLIYPHKLWHARAHLLIRSFFLCYFHFSLISVFNKNHKGHQKKYLILLLLTLSEFPAQAAFELKKNKDRSDSILGKPWLSDHGCKVIPPESLPSEKWWDQTADLSQMQLRESTGKTTLYSMMMRTSKSVISLRTSPSIRRPALQSEGLASLSSKAITV